MKVLEIIFFILLIVMIYPGINYLKKASIIPRKVGSETDPGTCYNGSKYYTSKKIWSDNGTCIYKFGGQNPVPVLGSSICRIYTYEQAGVSQKTDDNGNYNLLSNFSYVRPNINTAFDDFVNGNSHLSGKLTDINKDKKNYCTDADQLNVKYATKTCTEPNKKNSQNKCYNNKGMVVNSGKSFTYTSDCASSLCDGEISCISLNYASVLTREGESPSSGGVPKSSLTLQTTCISITQITVPPEIENVFDLDFYNQLGIINPVEGTCMKGPYPVKFKFDTCNNTDARQKFKIVRYSGKGTSITNTGGLCISQGVCGNLDKTLVYNSSGSYAAIIFRGLNSYLDVSSGGSFQLMPLPDKGVSASVKWIFFPETKLTNNTIPSKQRCEYMKGNIYADPSLVPGSSPGFGNNYQLNLPASVGGQGLVPTQKSALKNFKGEDTTKSGDGDAIGGELLEDFFTIGFGAGLPIASLIFQVLPDPSYDPIEPFIISNVKKGDRVMPTNFLGDVSATSDAGDPTVTPIENFCAVRELKNYPNYFLEAITDNTKIRSNFFDYNCKTGIHTGPRDVFSAGLAENAYGINIWNTAAKSTKPKEKYLTDDETLWEVKAALSEAIAFPKNYFTDSNLGSVKTFSPKDGVITSAAGGGGTAAQFNNLTLSSSGLITSIYLSDKDTEKQLDVSGRVPGNYLGVSSFKNGGDGSALFNVSVINIPLSPVSYGSKVGNLVIKDPGNGYKKGDKITINYTQIGGSVPGDSISFGVSSTATEVFIFKALSTWKNKNTGGTCYYSPDVSLPSNILSPISSGFEIITDYSKAGTITLLGNESGNKSYLPRGVISRGEGYNPNDIIYLIQYDIYGNNLNSHLFDSSGLLTGDKSNILNITVTEINSSGFNYDTPAKEVLFSGNKADFKLEYNFMDNAKNIFSSSPQQIVYGGEIDDGINLISKLSSSIEGNLTSDVVTGLAMSSPARDQNSGTLSTGTCFSILNLKSIQIKGLKYKSVALDKVSAIEPTSVGSCSIVLGRFIPYSYFSPAYTDGDQDTKKLIGDYFHEDSAARNWNDTFASNWGTDDFVLKYGVSEYYYNENYTQLIPYGVPDVYNNSEFLKRAPKF